MAGAPLGGRDSPRHSPEWKGKKEEEAEEEARADAKGGERGGWASEPAGGRSMPLGLCERPRHGRECLLRSPGVARPVSAPTPLRTRLRSRT